LVSIFKSFRSILKILKLGCRARVPRSHKPKIIEIGSVVIEKSPNPQNVYIRAIPLKNTPFFKNTPLKCPKSVQRGGILIKGTTSYCSKT